MNKLRTLILACAAAAVSLPVYALGAKPDTPQTTTTEAQPRPTIDIILWKDNAPVVFKAIFKGKAGDYGSFERTSTADFWEAENGRIAMRCYDQAVYANGNMREYEYIYEGSRIGDTIVFDRRHDSMNGYNDEPEWETIESYQPNTLVIKSPTSFEWDGVTFVLQK